MKTHLKLVCAKQVAGALDRELSIMLKEIEHSADPDSFGMLDHYEQIHGIGFAVCQTFLTSVNRGLNKSASFAAGPFHSSGNSYAQISNACANYWKHNEEWERYSLSSQARGTIEVIESLGIDVWCSYPLSQVLYVLFSGKHEATFTQLLNYLNQWSREVE